MENKPEFEDNAKDIIKMLGGWENFLEKEKSMRKFNKLLQEVFPILLQFINRKKEHLL